MTIMVTEIIRKQIRIRHYTLQDVCDKINALDLGGGKVSPQNISNMLNSDDTISPILVKKIEVALNLPSNSLVGIMPEFMSERTRERVEEIERRRKVNKTNKSSN